MRKLIFAMIATLMLIGGSSTNYHDEAIEVIQPVDPQIVTCFDNSEHVCYDPNFDVVVPEPIPVNRNVHLALARICISEAGFQTRTNDCTMIYHALRTRSRTGEVTLGIMRAYAPLSFNLNRTDNHRWVAHLRPDLREPRGWRETTTIPWSSRREGFRQVYEHVGTLLRNRPENPCGVRIDHWGARYFRRNTLIRRGWTPIECGETLNQFWSLPE